MKMTIEAKELAKVLKDVVKVVPAKATNYQKYVLITANADDDRVDFTTTSNSESLRRTLFDVVMQSPVEIVSSGQCLLPAKELVGLADKLEGKIAVSSIMNGDPNQWGVEIKAGKSKFKLNGLDPALFTAYQNDAGDKSVVNITATSLRSILEKTLFATANSVTSPILQGVNLNFVSGKVKATAMDMKRLSIANAACNSDEIEEDDTANITVGKEPLMALLSMLPKDDDEVVLLEIGDVGVAASWGDDSARLVMRSLEGNFPDVSRAIPKQYTAQVRVNRVELLKACERIELFAGENESRWSVFDWTNGSIHLSTVSASMGNAEDEVDMVSCNSNSSNILPMKFNTHYWIEALRALDSEVVEIRITEQDKPVVVKPVDGANDENLEFFAPLMYRNTATVATNKTA